MLGLTSKPTYIAMSNSRAHNFSAGPAALPIPVLEQAQEELVNWQGTGASVMEVSHRGKEFVAIAEQAEADLRTLLGASDDYAVLFLQGGATQAFATVPLNLAPGGANTDYVITGAWGQKAIKEAAKLTDARVAASSEGSGFTDIVDVKEWSVRTDAAYVHYTPNETIHGVEYHEVPDTGGVPLVADASSTILSRPIPLERFGAIYGGAQKNIGPAGLTVMVIRRDLMEKAPADLPLTQSFAAQAAKGSMLNTPPTFGWYLAGLVFQWLLDMGGLEAVGRLNKEKADTLYQAIDDSDFYTNPVAERARSWMNVPFVLADSDRDADFLARANDAGLQGLKGHRSVGGMRASIYNAVPLSSVHALVDFMQDFERHHA